MVAYNFIPSIQKVQAEGSLWVHGYFGLYIELKASQENLILKKKLHS